MNYPISVNFLTLQQYDLEVTKIDEVIFFEWLVVKRLCFGNETFFYQQIRVVRELGIKRSRLESIRKKFSNYGLTIELNGPNNVTNYHVDDKFISTYIKEHVKKKFQKNLLKRVLKLDFSSNKSISNDDQQEVLFLINELDHVFNLRRQLNSNELRSYSDTELPRNKKSYTNLYKLLQRYNPEVILHSFTAYCDSILTNEDTSLHMLNNFSSYNHQDDSFPVFERYLTRFNSQYSIQLEK